MSMNLFIVIPCHNRRELTGNCLASLQKQSYQDFSVVVVDDGSTDGTSDMIRERFPGVHLLHGDGSLWWTGGVNKGIEYALEQGADYVITLNDDTLHAPDFVEKMVHWGKQEPNAVMGALEVDEGTGELLFGREIFDKSTSLNQFKNLPEAERTGLKPVRYLPGRGLWIPRAVFEKIGLFDIENFPHYLADYDFTFNAQKAGFPEYMNFDARILTYPEESGEVQNRMNKTLKNYYNHLFSMRGGANLKDFTRYVTKNVEPSRKVPILMEGYARRILGYWLK